YNEAHNVDWCVLSLREGVDAVVVWDSGSTDDTVARARRAGALVVQRPFDNYAGQRQAALDSINEKLTLNLLYTLLKNSGIGLVLITHDMRIVRELADDVTVLRSGELIEKITLLNKNMNKLQSEYSQKLVSKSL
ncbi:MAG TPA: hypothetical protein PLL86_23695, partial [Leptospiraceae bacterium]|nr:hypothetical protein [Leptospiraceae bacterium]